MKKIIILLLFFITKSAMADQNVQFNFEPCLKKIDATTWIATINYNTYQCGQGAVNQFAFWVYYAGTTYGPLPASSIAANFATFVIPTALNSVLDNGECIQVNYNWHCGLPLPPNFYDDPVLGWYDGNPPIYTVCPCSENEDKCVAHFSYSLNSSQYNTSSTPILLDDNDYGYLEQYFTTFIQQSPNCAPSVFPGCIGFVSKYIKVTDTWEAYNSATFTSVSYNSISNPTMYDATHVNMYPFYIFLPVNGSGTNICHKKTISVVCKYNSTNCPHDNIETEDILYECTVCQYICDNKPSVEAITYTPLPDISKGKISNKTTTNVSVYPNPTSSNINVKGIEGDATFNLVDVLGRTVKTVAIKNINSDVTIPTDGLAIGTYTLKITQNENTITKSVVIAK